jgi:DNA-binding CsgD family transcriptional regulator
MQQVALERLRHLATLMIAAAVDADQWARVLEGISATAGGVPVHVIGHDRASGLHLGHVQHGYDPETVRRFVEHYSGDSPWLYNVLAEPLGRAIPCALMCPDAAVERTAFYADVVRPFDDIIGGGGAVLARTEGSAFKIGGCVPRRHRDRLEPALIDLLNLLIDPLTHAWQLGRSLAGGALERQALAGHVLGATAMFVLSPTGRLAHSNAEGAAMLAAGGLAGADLQGRLRFAAPAAQARLQVALHGLRHGALPVAAFSLRGEGGGGRVTLSGIAADVLGDGPVGLLLGAGCPCLLVVVNLPPVRGDAIARLMALHGLTRAEAEVAQALAEGLTPAAIADARSASLSTVRNQIKAAMGKCGVTRQAQLSALVARGN